MKPFRFRADALLQLRRRRRDAEQIEFSLAEQAVREATADVEHAGSQVSEAAEAYARVLAAGGDSNEFVRHRYWIDHLRTERTRLRTVLDEKTAVMHTAVERLRGAHQEVRVLERLRDRAWKRHQEAVRQEERRDIDEFAVLQFSRQRLQGGMGRNG